VRRTSAPARTRRRTVGRRLQPRPQNPRAKEDITHLPPRATGSQHPPEEQRIAEIMGNIQKAAEG